MSQTFRQPEILEIARLEGKVTVDGLAERFGVTVQTIRRDLTELADNGKLDRVHGGAVLPSGVSNIGYEDRRALNADAKTRMAALAVQHIHEDSSLFLDIGTSTEAVARALLHHRNIMVVTNNLNVANILVGNPDCEVVMVGGSLRRTDGGIVGPLTIRTVEQFKFDIAIMGCSSVDADGDILDYDIQEVGVSQTVIRQARQTFLVADHSKFLRSAPACVGSLRDIDMVVTDAPIDDGIMTLCGQWGTQVAVCDA